MYTLNDIVSFIQNQIGVDQVKENDDIYNDLGCAGDDFHELIDAYAKRYNVDMNGYLWYFHADEEGSWNSFGGSFFKSPNERVKHIPVTPLMLLEFANKGKWGIDYPEHNLPKYRYDLLINQVLILLFIVYVFYSCFRR